MQECNVVLQGFNVAPVSVYCSYRLVSQSQTLIGKSGFMRLASFKQAWPNQSTSIDSQKSSSLGVPFVSSSSDSMKGTALNIIESQANYQ